MAKYVWASGGFQVFFPILPALWTRKNMSMFGALLLFSRVDRGRCTQQCGDVK